MSRRGGLALAALLTGCGSLPTTSDGVAFLQVETPTVTSLAVGDTLRLKAVTLDASGAPIVVPILWRTPDTTVSVEAATGLVTALAAGPGRVQAVVGDDELVSDFIVLTVTEPPAPPQPGFPPP